MSKARRSGDSAAAFKLADRLENLSLDSKNILIKAFSNYFQLINIAEDLQRIRVIRQREAKGTLARIHRQCDSHLARDAGKNGG